ncbi:MAG: flagellar biosynthesis protein FlgI [Polaromonas sp. 39-63-203]|jgi:flagellar P-ring protein precursor FlgI|uniref:flagellar basal body P-ring protein FlgI n=1 Tax=Polaromonas sp. TaxID=1869339 RepID=UPI000BD34F95|nr:flagellar basal body P-ring protein FlgI [Polaromonas sp.]OYY53574.1 MAG: flagellar biosynthesis protein FlgI [Polaromonas sp. 35-63-240]OYZ03235.1 MAG: flagellar biosynthesis protein FlgI [Polaromonas sp. 28-63-22]OYZ85004.1 MAG: flagellar biosynthesis protein FlgI [Polaromonas sp. 24-62-144]OZB02350.1 MAG: flagellar biosynthesis protein FlgI [Polaromonas sp. 39-63-203]HQS32628.1 flagellar basal body P-ring protein FlgI [Polaromonas sp.]
MQIPQQLLIQITALAGFRPRLIPLALLALLAFTALPSQAERLKDLASIQGVRDNPLIGYGLMVGLDGSGDQTQQTPFTTQSLNNMLGQLGVTVPPGTNMQLKNVAAVMVTAVLPPFVRPGQNIDITVSSMGNAKSLRGGTLLMTPLKGSDGQVYALAQGNMVIGGAGASAGGTQVKINQLLSGRIPAGAIVERAVESPLGGDGTLLLEMNTSDFGTVQKAVDAINRNLGTGTATALDARVIQVTAPSRPEERVSFLARIQNIDVAPEQAIAKVVINARTGSVVMNQAVRIQDCAVAHGNLTVVINTEPVISQPGPFSGGSTVVAQRSQIELSRAGSALQVVRGGASLADVIKGLNSLGANPQDLVSILQAMKAVGALRAELEII